MECCEEGLSLPIKYLVNKGVIFWKSFFSVSVYLVNLLKSRTDGGWFRANRIRIATMWERLMLCWLMKIAANYECSRFIVTFARVLLRIEIMNHTHLRIDWDHLHFPRARSIRVALQSNGIILKEETKKILQAAMRVNLSTTRIDPRKSSEKEIQGVCNFSCCWLDS